jgi:hypothetical protein
MFIIAFDPKTYLIEDIYKNIFSYFMGGQFYCLRKPECS